MLSMGPRTLEEKVSAKLSGYRGSIKGFSIFHRGVVSDGAFRFFNLLVDLCDWDIKHNSYGLVNFSVAELSRIYGRNETTIYRSYREELEKAELIRFQKGRFWIVNPECFHNPYLKANPGTLAEMQAEVAKTQEKVAKTQEDRQKIPPTKPNLEPIYKDSYKDVFNKGDWKDYLVNRNRAKDPCFCGSGKSLEDCCGSILKVDVYLEEII